MLNKPLSVDPKQKFEEGNKTASLTAEIACRDMAKISWFKDSIQIHEGDAEAKYRMIWSGATKRLVVAAPLCPEDNGVYEILVEHRGGAKVSSLIDVKVAGWTTTRGHGSVGREFLGRSVGRGNAGG